ncbi:MAG: YtxH domain-containing protein [Sphaerobacter sp.]|nr:YtxH domain-containing protein [Sphaerobacter sp.]
MADDRHEGAFILGVVLGAIAGASATLWLTPRSGEELRADIVRRARAVERRAREMVGRMPGRAGGEMPGEEARMTGRRRAPRLVPEPDLPSAAPAAPTVTMPPEPGPTSTGTSAAPPPEGGDEREPPRDRA